MALKCPQCGKKHDVAAFDEGGKICCACGFKLDLSLITSPEDFLRHAESDEERKQVREIQQEADMVCRMILDDDCPAVDINLAEEKLKEKVLRLFPAKAELYEMIYAARFNRLREQFRRPAE